MRHVFNNHSQCVHVWAANTQSDGRAGNVAFNNGTIYSYGYWPMATFAKNKRGREVVLIREEKYSSSTSQHQSMVWHATSHLTRISLHGNLSNNIDDWYDLAKARRSTMALIVDVLASAKRARKYTEHHVNRAHEYADDFNELLAFVGNRKVKPITWNEDFNAVMSDLMAQTEAQAKRDAKERKARIAAHKKKEAEQKEKAKVNLADWVKGERVPDTWMFRDLPCVLRLHGDLIQTSHGAEVPLSYARRLWTLVSLCRKNGNEYEPKDFEVGAFRLRRVTISGDLEIGCHFIPYESIKPIAEQLNFPMEVEHA